MNPVSRTSYSNPKRPSGYLAAPLAYLAVKWLAQDSYFHRWSRDFYPTCHLQDTDTWPWNAVFAVKIDTNLLAISVSLVDSSSRKPPLLSHFLPVLSDLTPLLPWRWEIPFTHNNFNSFQFPYVCTNYGGSLPWRQQVCLGCLSGAWWLKGGSADRQPKTASAAPSPAQALTTKKIRSWELVVTLHQIGHRGVILRSSQHSGSVF